MFASAVDMIEFNQVSRNYGRVTAVDQLTLTIQPGELFALLGPNGAGKTTTIKMIVGLLRPTTGGCAHLRVRRGPLKVAKQIAASATFPTSHSCTTSSPAANFFSSLPICMASAAKNRPPAWPAKFIISASANSSIK